MAQKGGIGMDWLWIGFFAAAALMLALLTAYICYRMAFVAKKRKQKEGEYDIPVGRIYAPYRDKVIQWVQEVRAMPRQEFFITSHDGLKLCARYYEYAPGAPIELMFHGYRGTPERDLPSGVQRCFKVGRSALVVEQRACGRSEGKVISFGINEHKDCLAWIDFTVRHFGADVEIILTGISMGAATVLMAADKELPSNVVGVLADCGYNSAKEVIQKVIRDMHLPAKLLYPFVKLGAKLFGRFDLEETDPETAVKNCKIPVIFYHGEADDFVPCYMSRKNYDACASRKQLVTVPGAGHGLSYAVDPQKYVQTLRAFFETSASEAQQ